MRWPIQILQIENRPDGNLPMIFSPQFRPDGAHTNGGGIFGGPQVTG